MSVSVYLDQGLSPEDAYDLNHFVETSEVASPREVAKLEALATMLDDLARDGISRNDAATLYKLVPSLADDMPVGAYTSTVSRVNLDYALEGIAGAISTGIKFVLKGIFKLVAMLFKFVTAPIKWMFGADVASSSGKPATLVKVEKKLEALNGSPKKVTEMEENLEEALVQMVNSNSDALTNIPGLMGQIGKLQKAYVGAVWNASEIKDKYVGIFGEKPRASFVCTQIHDFQLGMDKNITSWGNEFDRQLKKLGWKEDQPGWTIPITADCSELVELMRGVDIGKLQATRNELTATALRLIKADDMYSKYHDSLLIASGPEGSSDKVSEVLAQIASDASTATGALRQAIVDCKAPYTGDFMKQLPVAMGFNKSNTKTMVKAITDLTQSTCVRYDDLGLNPILGAISEEPNVLRLQKELYRLALTVDNSQAAAFKAQTELQGKAELDAKREWFTYYDQLDRMVKVAVTGANQWLNRNGPLAKSLNLDLSHVANFEVTMRFYKDGLSQWQNMSSTFIRLYMAEAAQHNNLFLTCARAYEAWQKPKSELSITLMASNTFRIELAERWVEIIKKLGIKATDEDIESIYRSTVTTEFGVIYYPKRAIELCRGHENLAKWSDKYSKELSELMAKDIEITSKVVEGVVDGDIPLDKGIIKDELELALRFGDKNAEHNK